MLQDGLTDGLRALAAELDALASAADPAPSAFPSLPDFESVSLLGCGGMGTVYVARQISLGRNVAVKVVPSTAMRGASTSLPAEARTIASLHHPNIVQVFSAGRAEDVAWFAMELVRGESAAAHAFASADDVARLGVAVAEALAYAHRCGILHRDVKPSNIFMGADGRVKLGDFGLACLADACAKDGSGTARYRAPEVRNGGVATAAGDQYALGVTLRELAGALAQLPADFAAILRKATQADPTRRYADVEAMLADLRRFLAREPAAANPPSLFRRFRLLARRNPLAAFGMASAVFGVVAFCLALAVGYVKTARALDAAQREAAHAAQSLAETLTRFDRSETDPRETELRRAQEVVEALAARFPDDPTIKASAEAIRKVRERRAAHPWRPRRPRGP